MPPSPHPANVSRSAYSDAEREFIMAMERYMRESHRPFPSWHEVLEVLKSLGYRKIEAGIHHRGTEDTEKDRRENDKRE